MLLRLQFKQAPVLSFSSPHAPLLQARKFAGVLLLKNLIILDTSTTVTVREVLDIYPVPLHIMYGHIVSPIFCEKAVCVLTDRCPAQVR